MNISGHVSTNDGLSQLSLPVGDAWEGQVLLPAVVIGPDARFESNQPQVTDHTTNQLHPILLGSTLHHLESSTITLRLVRVAVEVCPRVATLKFVAPKEVQTTIGPNEGGCYHASMVVLSGCCGIANRLRSATHRTSPILWAGGRTAAGLSRPVAHDTKARCPGQVEGGGSKGLGAEKISSSSPESPIPRSAWASGPNHKTYFHPLYPRGQSNTAASPFLASSALHDKLGSFFPQVAGMDIIEMYSFWSGWEALLRCPR